MNLVADAQWAKSGGYVWVLLPVLQLTNSNTVICTPSNNNILSLWKDVAKALKAVKLDRVRHLYSLPAQPPSQHGRGYDEASLGAYFPWLPVLLAVFWNLWLQVLLCSPIRLHLILNPRLIMIMGQYRKIPANGTICLLFET